MNQILKIIIVSSLLAPCISYGQSPDTIDNKSKDEKFIEHYEDALEPDKVLHAEPLYIDLIRDLGARKGEKEWNLGYGITDNLAFDSYEALVEYEFAPVDRLGFEFELPFLFYSGQNNVSQDSIPSNRLESIKLAAQWSFFVSEKMSTSMALGYINEFEMSDFDNFGSPLFTGNIYNPFFVIAKRWGNNFHTLIYTGPRIEQDFESNHYHTLFEINTNLHYMISGTRNFIGIEFNKIVDEGTISMTMRPQMRIEINENFLIGIVTGIPVNKELERLSAFTRIIWELGHD